MDAEQHCNRFGTHLATITTIDDLHNGLEYIIDSNAWIGLYDNNIWLDGTELNINDTLDHYDLKYDSKCKSLQIINGHIGNKNNCEQSLPFLCDKHPKSRQYRLIQQSSTLIEAQRYCLDSFGTDLATISNPLELSEVLRIIPLYQSAWIGLKKEFIDSKQEWKWIDQSQCDNCDEYWSEHEPIHDCSYLSQINNAIKTAKCTDKLDYFLCNKRSKHYILEQSGNLIVSDKQILYITDSDNNYEYETDPMFKSMASAADVWHNGRILYYPHANEPYESIYKFPQEWILFVSYIALVMFIVCGFSYCLLCIFLNTPKLSLLNQYSA